MAGRYKRFLYTEEDIPRSTAWRRRQRTCQRVSLKNRNSYHSDQVLIYCLLFIVFVKFEHVFLNFFVLNFEKIINFLIYSNNCKLRLKLLERANVFRSLS